MRGARPFRLAEGGAIDRNRVITVRFDGRHYSGHPGDTLAALLMANGVRLFGRSFKYHRPRGILGLGHEEPNALVTLREGARLEPNTRATTVEAFDGLCALSQNRFPGLRWDVGAVNGLLQRFLVAGFYYKTFMWPASFWERVYEPLIRRAAGLGRATTAPDPDRYAHQHAHADVVIAGAGPSGLMAALCAGSRGARVVLVESRPWLGGRLAFDREQIDERPAAEWVAGATAKLEAMPNVRILRRATLTGVYDHTVVTALERVADHRPVPETGEPRQRLWLLRARRVVIAAGAVERPMVFPGNDRPGVMLASAVRGYLNRFAVAPGQRVVVATNNDDAYATVLDLHAHGVAVGAIVDARASAGPLAEEARVRGVKVLPGTVPLAVHGRIGVRAVDIGSVTGGRRTRLDTDCLAVSGGYTPDLSLAGQAGQAPVWAADIATFVPGDLPAAFEAVGAAAGQYGLDVCLAQGAIAGDAAAVACGFTAGTTLEVPEARVTETAPIQSLWQVPGRGKAFVDFQNDVTREDVEIAHREGLESVEHVKRYTTLGMGTDQGRTSSVNGHAILAAARSISMPNAGTTRFRPPTEPVAVGAFAGHRRGREFAPVRRTAMHDWHEARGARFIEAGHWLRPAAYPIGDESLLAATWREASAVRATAGLCDVSTLGKIDVMGSDAAEFLNRIYINGFRKLAVGRVRYGAMLRPDGHLFDDGTTTRLAMDHFVMTTTTANAARVLAHLEYYAQVAWPELDVAVCSATEQWATMALAGPCSRQILAAALPDVDVGDAALPFMGFLELTSNSFPVRLFRISFSGELAYEISVPWGYGEPMWHHLMAKGAPFGITPYGTEALGVLRIEKGHPAGPEFDGRTTAGDIGLGDMVANQKKDYVGKSLARRPGLVDPDRPALVGLRLHHGADRLRGGAHLVASPRNGLDDSLGWVSSVTYSPHVAHWIGLAFLRGGAARQGEHLYAVYPLHDEVATVEICSPCFVDPQGRRLRG